DVGVLHQAQDLFAGEGGHKGRGQVQAIGLVPPVTEHRRIVEGLVAGAEAYLTKPFDADELRALITRLTDQRRILQEKYSRLITLGAAPLQPALSLEEQFLQQVLQVIEENLDDDMFGVEQLASGVNMSRSNLFRKLDALTGKSPTQLIRELRLERARQLIEQGAGNTTEVALLVGFNTPAYFVKCFVDQYGITPGELRKRHR
ncbi:MAG TPA: DNA-binding response regulator, partial [Saprospiraceae bacterium]|nr:DNA-binding response regulator [Saprospiraceae bacterium]